MKLYEIVKMHYGVIRRKAIITWLHSPSDPYFIGKGIPINKEWQIQSNDPDVKYLIKKGLVKFHRDNGQSPKIHNGLKRYNSRQTWLVLK